MRKYFILCTNGAIICVIILGFLLATFQNYTFLLQTKEADIENISTLTSEGIYSLNAAMLATPVQVSLTMANDTFLHAWLRQETARKDDPAFQEKLLDYLRSYRKLYKYDSVFMVSTKTQRYYHYNGISRVVNKESKLDDWYFAFIKEQPNYKLNIDKDKVNHNQITVFVDCKIADPDTGKMLGIIGVGMKSNYIQRLLKDYEELYGVSAYFIDKKGIVQVSTSMTALEQYNIFTHPSLKALENTILANTTTSQKFWAKIDGEPSYFVIQYVESMGWYLVVEQNTKQLNEKFEKEFIKTICIIVFITLIILAITTSLITVFNKRLLKAIASDGLTGLPNRSAFEEQFARYNKTRDTLTMAGVAIFDLNNLKIVNDEQGHKAGDTFLIKSAELIAEAFPGVALYRIGGDEFAALWTNIPEEIIAGYQQTLRARAAEATQESSFPISIASGYAYYTPEKYADFEETHRAADANMYCDKARFKQHCTPFTACASTNCRNT